MRLVPHAIQAASYLINGYPDRYAFASLSASESEGEGVLARRGEKLRALKSDIHFSSIGRFALSDVARATAVAPYRVSCVAIREAA